MMVPGHPYRHRGAGMHDDVGGESVQGNCLSIHVLLENVVPDLCFFVSGRVHEPHKQALDIYLSYFNVFKKTRKQEIQGGFA